MTDSDEEIFLTQNSFSNSLGSSKLDEIDVLEVTDGLFKFQHANQDIDISSVSNKIEESNDGGQNSEATKRTSKRNIVTVNDEELLVRNSERIPTNTKKTTTWCLSVWDDWATQRNSLPENPGDQFCIAPLAEILHTICDYELCFWLSKFVYEVRKKGGEEYPPNTIYHLCVGIQKHLRNTGLPGLELFKSPNFKLFNDALDSEMKRLTRKGIGITKKQAEPIVPQEKEEMWTKGVLGDKDPRTLLNTLVYLFGKFFALRSGEEHRNLTFSQLNVIEGIRENERGFNTNLTARKIIQAD